MDDEFEHRLVAVRADTAGFARDVALMRETLDGGLGQGAARAGRAIETSLLAAVRSGRLGFEELRGVALKALDQIASAGLRAGIDAVTGGVAGSLGGGLGGLLARLLGAPGRATGGPVVGGRAYTVGERGPELFVPSSSGRIEPVAAAGAREVRVAITVQAAGAGEAAGVLAQSSRQVARAVKAALEG